MHAHTLGTGVALSVPLTRFASTSGVVTTALRNGTKVSIVGGSLAFDNHVTYFSTKDLADSTSLYNTQAGNYANSATSIQVITQIEEVEVIPKKVLPGKAFSMVMPDGSTLYVDELGNYRIDDADAKVTYQAHRLREFNRYINASDLLAEFIEELAKLGANEDKVLHVPIGTFIAWLIHKAAEQDHEDPPADVPTLAIAAAPSITKPRCKCCGRFIASDMIQLGLSFCNGTHADRWLSAHHPHKTKANKELMK